MPAPLIRNVTAHYAGLLFLGLSNILLVPVLLHYLGTEKYGIFNLCLGAIALLQFLEMGIGSAGVKYVAEWKVLERAEAIRQFYSSGLLLFFLIGASGAVLLYFLAPSIAVWSNISSANLPSAVLSLRITGLGLLFFFPCILLRTFLEGYQRYDLSNAAQAFQSAAALFMIIGGVWNGASMVMIIALFALSYFLEFLLLFIFKQKMLKEVRFQRSQVRFVIFRRVRELSFWNFVWNLASKISWDLDIFVISFFRSAQSVTPFVLGRKLPNLVSIVASRWVQVLHPLSSELEARGEQQELKALYLRGTTICLSFVLPATLWLIFLSDATLKMWLRDFPSVTGRIQVLLSIAILADLVHSVSAILLAGKGMLKKVSLYYLLEAVLNLILSIWWVQWFGVAGVAAATATSTVVVVSVFQIPYACRVFGITFSGFFRLLIRPHILPAICCAVILMSAARWMPVSNFGIWIVISLTAGAAYLGVLWFFGFSELDRISLRRAFAKKETTSTQV